MALPSNFFALSPPLKKLPEIFLWLFSITAKPQLMLNRKWYQASKQEMEFHMINIIYVALPTQEGFTIVRRNCQYSIVFYILCFSDEICKLPMNCWPCKTIMIQLWTFISVSQGISQLWWIWALVLTSLSKLWFKVWTNKIRYKN